MTIIYLTSLFFFSGIIAFLLSYWNFTPRPEGLLFTMPGSSFPAINLVIATAFYGFILFYINIKHSLLTNTFKTFIWILLGINGLAAIYLGDYWFSDVISAYLLGIILCLIHWILYRKFNYSNTQNNESIVLLLSVIAAILCFTALSTSFNFKTLVHNHAPYHQEFILTESAWWDQKEPVLPLYRLNRIGRKISLLNIQYSGDLNLFESSLEQHGWKQHSESFYTKLLMRMNNANNGIKLPLLTQLYENKRPDLIMTYNDKQSKIILVLTLWESNYNIHKLNNPIWIGTVHQDLSDKSKNINPRSTLNLMNPIPYINPALRDFTLRRIEVPENMINAVTYPTAPYILLIKSH